MSIVQITIGDIQFNKKKEKLTDAFSINLNRFNKRTVSLKKYIILVYIYK